MIKQILSLINKIKCKINCCFKSECNGNEEKKIEEIEISYKSTKV